MHDQYPTESTPLIRNSSNGPIDHNPENSQDENITFYDRPTTPVVGLRQSHGYYTNGHTLSRSDESSLATLAVEKKMSDPRRTFCLFATFDFILTVLLWLIEIGMSSTDQGFFSLLHQQVTEFQLHTSLFDVVVLAFIRFLFLVVTYAVFHIKHWWPVALSTAVSDAALIIKIFAVFPGFGKHTSGSSLNVPMTCVLILTDFILTWIEVWFIDFKVLPAETKLAQKTAQAFLQRQSFYTAPSVDMFLRRPQGGASVFGGGSFYSPAATPAPSEGGFTGVESMYYSMRGYQYHQPAAQFTPGQLKLIDEGRDSLERLWSMYQNNDIWEVEKTLNNGDIVHSTEQPPYGKSFKITSTVPGRSPDVIVREIVLKPEEMPTWNKTVSDVKILQRIGEQTCVTLEVSAPAAMGLISSREFITVRRFEKRDDVYISAGISTDQCEDIVPKSTFVRGINGPTGFIVKASDTEPHSSTFTWILNTDLKGNLSRGLVNRNLTRTLIDFVSFMKSHLKVDA